MHHLPSLEVGSNKTEASVVTGDWMARIAPIMRSLSPNAPTWRAKVTATASSFYDRWLHADPLQKLTIKTEAVGAKADYGVLARIEERLNFAVAGLAGRFADGSCERERFVFQRPVVPHDV